jgi:DNA-directed RNA polymerase subunit M/transcription elongation factor TFIIS
MKQTICPNCGGSLESVAIGWKCKKCKGFISLQDGKFYEYEEKPFMPPQTRADRIRAMSDEELAKCLLTVDDDCKYCKNLPECDKLLDTPEGIPEEKCLGCLVEWLREPEGEQHERS